MFQTDASQLRLSNAKSDAGFDGFSTTSSKMTCKCAFDIFFGFFSLPFKAMRTYTQQLKLVVLLC
ncbi:hypothetical protein CP371_09870 [Pediococcus acidilactici]|nr:hypothetical protein CP371_09870 [Pediococcus acidilactici]PEG76680.1 hypothetical protein CP370_09175 [Lactobacillus sp. UMNPBX19]